MKMPVMFVGHGNPMNAITDNVFKENWKRIGKTLQPRAILCVSAHWYINRTRVNPREDPEQIYDMYGFPEELYAVKYPVKGSRELADRVIELLGKDVEYNSDWGIDHGTWAVLKWMFPAADIPVMQLSINGTEKAPFHFDLGRMLAPLREEGILIIGSGNIVHNLSKAQWGMADGFDWAYEFDGLIRDAILAGDFEKAVSYRERGESALLAVPTPDHYYPLMYALGAATPEDQVLCFNECCEMGSMSMTGYLFGTPEDVAIDILKS